MYESDPHDLHSTLERDLKLRNLAARLGDSGPPRRLRAEWAKSCSGLKKATGGVNFRCGEGIGLNQSFEAQLWRSRRTERPLTGVSDHSLNFPAYTPWTTSGLLEALIFYLGRYELLRRVAIENPENIV